MENNHFGTRRQIEGLTASLLSDPSFLTLFETDLTGKTRRCPSGLGPRPRRSIRRGTALALAEMGQQARDFLTALLAVAGFVEAAVAAVGHGLIALAVAVDHRRELAGFFFLLSHHRAIRLVIGELAVVEGVAAEAGLGRDILAHIGWSIV